MALVSKTAQDIFAPANDNGQPRSPSLQQMQVWGTEIESLVGITATAAAVFDTRSNLYASLAYAANTLAWVVNDTTVAYNGIYRKSGASGSGSWTRVGDLPYSFAIGTDTGAGTANAIQVTTSIPVSDGMIVAFTLYEATTAGPVTVSFNGGTAMTLKTPRGANASSLGAGQEVWLRVRSSDSTARMISDQDVAALVAQAEAAKTAAEEARDEAVATISVFSSIASAVAANPDTSAIRVNGGLSAGDGKDGIFASTTGDPDPFIGANDKFQTSAGDWFIRTDAKFLKGGFAPQDWFVDDINPVRIDRTIGRFFGGLAAETAYGASVPFETPGFRRLSTWLNGWMDDEGVNRAGPGYYLEEGAGLLWISRNGSTAITGATRSSDRYRVKGYKLWKTGETVAIGAKRYWASKFYTATTAGVTGSSGPTHSSGTGSDGAVTWQYNANAPGSSIGVAAVAVSDTIEPNGAIWALYNEAQREADGATIFTREVATKNKGSNVHNHPYSMFPGGSTIGDWFAGGGDPATGAPTAPSTCAILIGKNGHAWNKGLVFGHEGIAATANGAVAIAFAQDHRVAWFTNEASEANIGAIGAAIDSSVSETARKSTLSFKNDGVNLSARGNIIASFENGAAGANPNYLRVISKDPAAGGIGAAVEIRADGPGANVDLMLDPKGGGLICIGQNVLAASTPSNFTADRMLFFKGADGSTYVIPCRSGGW